MEDSVAAIVAAFTSSQCAAVSRTCRCEQQLVTVGVAKHKCVSSGCCCVVNSDAGIRPGCTCRTSYQQNVHQTIISFSSGRITLNCANLSHLVGSANTMMPLDISQLGSLFLLGSCFQTTNLSERHSKSIIPGTASVWGCLTDRWNCYSHRAHPRPGITTLSDNL